MSNFQTTRWSLIVGARAASPAARTALDELCRAYRPPVLAYLRCRGLRGADAEDLAQAFFLHLLESQAHAHASPERGRFRNFLLTAVSNFLGDTIDARRARKRGGGAHHESLAPVHAETLAGDPELMPERAFERSWATTVLSRAVERLRADAVRSGKEAVFDRLREFLLDSTDATGYGAAAAELGMRGNTVAVTVHRLRERLRQRVREELAQTVDSDADVDAELAALRAALAS